MTQNSTLRLEQRPVAAPAITRDILIQQGIRPLPPVGTSPNGQWPLLRPTHTDLTATPDTAEAARVIARPIAAQRPVRQLRLGRPTAIAIVKGLIISVAVIAIAAGIVPSITWWVGDWHWLGALMFVGGLAGLFGVDVGLIAAVGILVVPAIPHVSLHPLRTAGAVLWITAIRVLWEWLLAFRTY